MARPNVVKLVGVDSKNGEIIAVYISHELSGYKGKFVPDRPHGEWKNERFSESHALYFGKCSQCGKTGVTGNFCSVCGSDNRKMGEAE